MRNYFIKTIFLVLVFILPVVLLAHGEEDGVSHDHPVVENSTNATTPANQVPIDSDEPVLIANINIQNVSTSTNEGKSIVFFSLNNLYGRQEGITYGVIMRSEETANVLASYTEPTSVSLNEGEVAKLGFAYKVPDYLSENATVVLAAYNKEGLPLAFKIIDTVLASKAPAVTCINVSDVVSCDLKESANADVFVRESTPQGKVVYNETIQIDSNTKIDLANITKSLPSGKYVFSVSIFGDSPNKILGIYTVDFVKGGDFAKIMSVSPRVIEGGKLEVTAYAEIGYTESNEPLSFIVGLGECASEQTSLYDEKVMTFTFDTTCTSGVVNAKLVQGAITLDTLEVNFTKPTLENSMETEKKSIVPLLIVIMVAISLITGFIWYFVNRNKYNITVPPPTMLLILFFSLALFGFGSVAEAATFAIGGSPSYNTCATSPGGMSCAEPSDRPAPTTVGTVTVPDSVDQGDSYTVNYTISVSNSLNTHCSGAPCTSSNTIVYVYDNLPSLIPDYVGMHLVFYYNTLPVGYHGSPEDTGRPLIHYKSQGTSGSFTRVAPSSGTQDVLTFLTQPGGSGVPVSSCTPSWCLTYPLSRRNATVNLNAPSLPTPSVNLQFLN